MAKQINKDEVPVFKWDVEILDPAEPTLGKHTRRFSGNYPNIHAIRAAVQKDGLEFFRARSVHLDDTPLTKAEPATPASQDKSSGSSAAPTSTAIPATSSAPEK